MSAVGAVPGYAYPQFVYPESELLVETPSTITFAAAGSIATTVHSVGGGSASYVQGLLGTFVATAAVSTRTIVAAVLNADGVQLNSFECPLLPTANQIVGMTWNVQLATAYSVGINAYSPWEPMVLPPGYVVQFICTGVQIGDRILSPIIKGVRIPTVGESAPAPAPIPRPLLT